MYELHIVSMQSCHGGLMPSNLHTLTLGELDLNQQSKIHHFWFIQKQIGQVTLSHALHKPISRQATS